MGMHVDGFDCERYDIEETETSTQEWILTEVPVCRIYCVTKINPDEFTLLPTRDMVRNTADADPYL